MASMCSFFSLLVYDKRSTIILIIRRLNRCGSEFNLLDDALLRNPFYD